MPSQLLATNKPFFHFLPLHWTIPKTCIQHLYRHLRWHQLPCQTNPQTRSPSPQLAIRKLSSRHNRYFQPTHPPNPVRPILSDRPLQLHYQHLFKAYQLTWNRQRKSCPQNRPLSRQRCRTTPYEALYKCLRTSGLSKEDAAAGAKAALAVTKTSPSSSKAPTAAAGGNHVDCSTVSNQSYYNSQKLLQNQQQQTLKQKFPRLTEWVPRNSRIGSSTSKG